MTGQGGGSKPLQTLSGFCACAGNVTGPHDETQLRAGPDFVFSDHAALLVRPQLE